VRSLVDKADPRDVEKADAKQALLAVNLVKSEQGLWAKVVAIFGIGHRTTSDAEWLAYEGELMKLRIIERGVSTATALRTTLAKRYMTDAKAAVLTAEQNIEKAKAKLSDSVSGDNVSAKSDAAAAIANKTQLIAQFDQAVLGDARLKDEVDPFKKKLRELDAAAIDIATAADAKNNAIAAAAAEAARQAKLRQAARDEARARQMDDRAVR
jgi:hypothetical protein